MNNAIGKPAIFLRGRYVASGLFYLKYSDTYIYMFLTWRSQLVKNSGIKYKYYSCKTIMHKVHQLKITLVYYFSFTVLYYYVMLFV